MKSGPDLSIGQRLGLGFALVLLVIAGLGVAISGWAARSNAGQETLMTRVSPLGDAISALEGRLLSVAVGARAYLFGPTPEGFKRHVLEVEEARQALRNLSALQLDADVAPMLEKVRASVEAYLAEATRVVVSHEPQEAIAAERALAASRARMLGTVAELSRLHKTKRGQVWAQMHGAREQAAEGLALGIPVALGLFLLVSFLTVRSVRGPAQRLVEVATQLERGHWQPALAWAPRPGARVPSDEMLKLSQAFGAAALALERREQRLAVDGKIAAATASSLSKEAISQTVLQNICDFAGAEVGALYWRDALGNELVPLATQGLSQRAAVLSAGEGIPGRAASTRRPVIVRDIPPDSGFSVRLGIDEAPARCVVAVPVAVHGQVLGVLLVASLRELGEPTVAFLEASATQLGIGLQNVSAYEQIKKLLTELEETSARVQAQNEALQSQNEELQSQREEIHSQNKELQAQGEEIHAQNEELKAATAQLRAQTATLIDVDKRRTEFLAVLAHELRNPLAAISNSLFALMNVGAKADVRARAEQVIARQAKLLSRLVDDLLELTRVTSGKIRLKREAVDLAEVVRDCAADYQGAAQKAGVAVQLEVSGSVVVSGDRARLHQVLGSLLDNAIKFSGEGKSVRVKLEGGPQRATLTVTDFGLGIEPAVQPRLFQPFIQAQSSDALHKSGLGLGLSLVKSFVELHGGEVKVHSEGLGRGSTFTVKLPVGGPVGQPAAPTEQREPALVAKRILIIEDHVDAAMTLKDSMELRGHQVRVAFDAHEGLAVAREFRPDVLLCDIGLPSMDGYELARRFREDEELRSTFLIAVSGYSTPEDQERAARAGFKRHFAKPCDVERLQKVMNEL